MTTPKHVALIPDGNRTRAKENNKWIEEAYRISYQRGVDIINYTFTNTDVKVFTLRGLSTENANKRPPEELDFLMNMYKQVDSSLDKILEKNEVNFKRIWNPNGISEGFKNYLEEKSKKMKFNTDKYFVFGINYWWRDEIIRAIQKTAEQNKDLTKITEEELSSNLDLWNIPPVELVIRTKWDMAHRTSGFMSRRIGYAELHFTELKCPEFSTKDYQSALNRFKQIAEQRNFWK
jgi:undecaprenyl diphosphate synthase